MISLRNLVWRVFRLCGLGPLLFRVHPKSALRRLGWFRSFRYRRPVDAHGEPIPWWTYGAVDFLRERLDQSFRVVEIGCGYSTLWLGNRCREVVSLEDSPDWARFLRRRVSSNVRILDVPTLEGIDTERLADLGKFQVAVIDGGNRIECAKSLLDYLTQDGVLLWDNTDGPDWPVIRGLMREAGFREVSFFGLVPQEIAASRTSIFYRDGNCLGI